MGYPIATHIAQVFMMACSFVAAITGYFNRNRFHPLRKFYFYPLSSLIQMTFFYVIINCQVSVQTQNRVISSTANIFLIAEFFLIYSFFLNTLKSKSIKRLLYTIQVVYGLAVAFYWFILSNIVKVSGDLYFFQGFCILIPVLFYFYELFKWPTVNNLLTLPSFWISTGMVIYFACTLPLFLMKDFIFNKKGELKEVNLYLINFIAYGIMFLFIAKAYLCPKRDTP